MSAAVIVDVQRPAAAEPPKLQPHIIHVAHELLGVITDNLTTISPERLEATVRSIGNLIDAARRCER